MQTLGQHLAHTIIANALEGTDLFAPRIQIPQEWPNSAVFGVEYNVHDRQFPQVKHEPTTVFFDHVSELIQWLSEKREWIVGTDYDFTMTYSVYTWDWGPLFKYTKSM